MLSRTILPLVAALPFAFSQQSSSDGTILGAYIFHRHGDRTPKILAPANLTDLGYRQVYQSGEYYRSRYIASDADQRISGINSDDVLQSQLDVVAPDDVVLQSSAIAFLQALYPPVGSANSDETLANGTTVDSPMNGYQIVPVEEADTGSGSENAGWLQSTSDCGKAVTSSNEYFTSSEYNNLLSSTRSFYERLSPIIDGVFDASDRNFENAYTIYDYINVAEIHNSSIPSSDLLSDEVLFQLRTLADNHEWNLAYNASTPIRAVAGSQLAAEITQYLNSTIEDAGSHTGSKLGIQFGAYGTFMSFFGLAGLNEVNVDFTGVTDYASSMVFELWTNASDSVTAANYPSDDEIYVRFLYHNGTASDSSEPQTYPLFGSGQDSMPWSDFMQHMNKISIGDEQGWCTACGNTTGVCAAYAPEGSDSANDETDAVHGSNSCSNGISPAVNGVIGAMVTLAVVLGLEALILVLGGLRVVRKSKLAQGAASNAGSETKA